MQYIAGEVTFSYGPLQMDVPVRNLPKKQLCMDTECSLEDLPEAMDDRDEWQERVREIHASSMT